jgi:hypothetical protein
MVGTAGNHYALPTQPSLRRSSEPTLADVHGELVEWQIEHE